MARMSYVSVTVQIEVTFLDVTPEEVADAVKRAVDGSEEIKALTTGEKIVSKAEVNDDDFDDGEDDEEEDDDEEDDEDLDEDEDEDEEGE
jgi:ABC-type Zn2+ transport system substrate-binding protein/surface adhesin